MEWSEWSIETSFTTVAVPQADFVADRTEVVVGQPIQFTDLSTGGVNPLTWVCDLGDGSPVIMEQNPTQSHDSAATHTVGKTVAMPSRAVTVTVKYSDEDLTAVGGNPEKLVLALYNDATGKWTILDTTLNEADRSLNANTTHFGTWAVMAKKPSGGMASWIWIVLGIAAGLAVAVLVGRVVAVERTSKVRQEP